MGPKRGENGGPETYHRRSPLRLLPSGPGRVYRSSRTDQAAAPEYSPEFYGTAKNRCWSTWRNSPQPVARDGRKLHEYSKGYHDAPHGTAIAQLPSMTLNLTPRLLRYLVDEISLGRSGPAMLRAAEYIERDSILWRTLTETTPRRPRRRIPWNGGHRLYARRLTANQVSGNLSSRRSSIRRSYILVRVTNRSFSTAERLRFRSGCTFLMSVR